MLVFDWKHMRTMSEQRQTVQKESWTWHENRQQSINHSMQTTKKETERKKRKINNSMCQNGREIKIERENISNGQMIKSEKSRRKPRRENNSWPKRKVYLKNKNFFFKCPPCCGYTKVQYCTSSTDTSLRLFTHRTLQAVGPLAVYIQVTMLT